MLGVVAKKSFAAGDVVERCYCLPVQKSQIPSTAQLLPRHLFHAGSLLLFPFGWALLYRQTSQGGHNASWEHHEEMDIQGNTRHYVVIRATGPVLQGTELLLAGNAGRLPSVALEASQVQMPKPSRQPDFVDGNLPYCTSLEVKLDRSSEAAQGLSVCFYAKRDIAAGEELLISYGKTWWSSRGIHDATGVPQAQLLLPEGTSWNRFKRGRQHKSGPDTLAEKHNQDATIAGLALVGALVGPAVDAIHNQALLSYDLWPLSMDVGFGVAKTSLLVPPLLAIAYSLLGYILPQLFGPVGTESLEHLPLLRAEPGRRAGLAVLSTCLIIKSRSWKPAQGREKSRWQLPQAVRGFQAGAELFPEKSSLVQRSMLGTSTGDFKRRKPRTKAAAIHNVLAQVASSKTKLPHWPRPVESRSAGTLPRAVKEEDMRRTPSHPVKLPSTSMPSPMASMAPSQPWQPSQPPPQPAAQQELTEPVKESAEPEGSNCDLPEPIKWRAGSLVPSVADCLDRYYADLVPAEDVQRMREDLPEMLRRLCFFLVSGEAWQ
eukprot:g14078.t1